MIQLCKHPLCAKGVDRYGNEVYLHVISHIATYGRIADQVEKCVMLKECFSRPVEIHINQSGCAVTGKQRVVCRGPHQCRICPAS